MVTILLPEWDMGIVLKVKFLKNNVKRITQ